MSRTSTKQHRLHKENKPGKKPGLHIAPPRKRNFQRREPGNSPPVFVAELRKATTVRDDGETGEKPAEKSRKSPARLIKMRQVHCRAFREDRYAMGCCRMGGGDEAHDQSEMISGKQITAARALLDWDIPTLARTASVEPSTILAAEAGEDVSAEAGALIQQTLEAAGVDFPDSETVRKA